MFEKEKKIIFFLFLYFEFYIELKKCVLLAFGIVLLILHTAIFSLMTTNYRIYTTFYFFQYSFDAPPIFIIFFVLLFSSSLSSHLPRGLIFNFICHIFNCTICIYYTRFILLYNSPLILFHSHH